MAEMSDENPCRAKSYLVAHVSTMHIDRASYTLRSTLAVLVR